MVSIHDLVPGNEYYIYTYGHRYRKYIYFGMQRFRHDHIRYGFEKHDRKLYFWMRPWKIDIIVYQKTPILSTILKTIMSSLIHDRYTLNSICEGYF